MMNLKYIIGTVCLFLFLNSICIGQNESNDCSEFETGNYYYPMMEKDGSSTVRTKSKQVSYIKKSDMTLTWKMNWIDECKYEMTLKEIDKNDGVYKIGDRIVAEIKTVEGKCYYFDAVFYSDKYPGGKKFPQGKLCKE